MPLNLMQLAKGIKINGDPADPPDDIAPHILVIGGGVIGLVTSWVLLDNGYRVTIVAKEWASWTKQQRLTSQIAGGLWEYPPAVCGQHNNPISLSRSKRWCMVSYRIWKALAEQEKSSGVKMRKSVFFFPTVLEKSPAQYAKMLEIVQSGVEGFRRDPDLIDEHSVDPGYGVKDAYEISVPVIDTDQSMAFLMEMVKKKGANMIPGSVKGDLHQIEDELLEQYDADVIVNASGLAAMQLAGDITAYPSRGALIRVTNDGKDFPKLESALAITAHAAEDNQIIFLVPRNDKILLIGGIAQAHESMLDLTLDSPIVKNMRARCEKFLPALRQARLDPEYPLAQGLRPTRKRNVRVERELRSKYSNLNLPSRIVHSYGHGGAGWSLSFGCALDVVALVQEALCDLPPMPMSTVEPKIRRRNSSDAMSISPRSSLGGRRRSSLDATDLGQLVSPAKLAELRRLAAMAY